jgi:hypothetical protein
VSSVRSFQAWLIASLVIDDAPAAFKAERQARGESIASASRQMIGVSPYILRKFEDGVGVSARDVSSILLWMARGAVSGPTDPVDGEG